MTRATRETEKERELKNANKKDTVDTTQAEPQSPKILEKKGQLMTER